MRVPLHLILCWLRNSKGSNFIICGDNKSRDQGCVTKMLEKLKHSSLQDRRKQHRLAFFYKIVEGLVPAMPPHKFLEPERANERPIRATTKFKDFITSNVVEKHWTLNRRPYKTISTRTDQLKNSFFPRTVIDWNQLYLTMQYRLPQLKPSKGESPCAAKSKHLLSISVAFMPF